MSPISPDRSSAKLDSWKQIAGYLQREVRTAQRWEKSEGLPVHRHQHGTRGTVFAYSAEIDVWLESRTSAQQAPPAAGLESESESVLADSPADLAQGASTPQRSARPYAQGLMLMTLLALAVWFFGGAGGEGGEAHPGVQHSRLLVLPLEALGSDPLEESTGRALHEELITGLAGLAPERLSVIGRTSALRYGDTGLGLAEMGAAAGVEFILEGSIRRLGEVLKLTSRLVRTSGESEVWSASFQLEIADLAQAEARVARAVCEALARDVFAVDPPSRVAATVKPEARDAWRRGRYLWHKGTHQGFQACIEHFEQALDEDPLFAEAHVGLASAYVALGRYGIRPSAVVFPKAKAAALRALELNPEAAEAHSALAQVHLYYEWDFAAAAREFQEALRLGPGLALTHHAYAHFLSCLGLHEQGMAAAREARALEPLWPQVMVDSAWFYYRARDFEKAAQESRRALELEPGSGSAASCLVSCLERLGDDEAAWVAMRTYLDHRGLLATVPGIQGVEASKALHQVRLWNRAQVEAAALIAFLPAHSQVFSLSGLGREAEMLTWLERGLEAKDRVAVLMQVHPAFDPLRENPRFTALLERVAFPADPAALLD